MRYDPVPALLGLVVGGSGPELVLPTGPNRTEWTAAVFTVVALLVRELAWWVRNRRK